MRTEISLQACHGILLEIAQAFHTICTKHNIPYYMLGGTQLGAVRHGGIIPWDDDMDFGVPRQYFEELKKLLNAELDFPYKVLSIDSTPDYYAGFIKIEDSRTVAEFEEHDDVCYYGINIDIFPLDRTNSRVGFFSRNNLICQLYKVENYRFLKIEGLGKIKWLISKLLKAFLPFLNKHTIYNFIEKRLLINKGDHIANYYGAWGLKELVDASFFGSPTLYKFETTQFYGVEKPDQYLKCLYGDYMQIPPVNKRHVHIKSAYYK